MDLGFEGTSQSYKTFTLMRLFFSASMMRIQRSFLNEEIGFLVNLFTG